MKMKEILADVHEYSGKASDITRQLAFAGLAAIWIFKPEIEKGMKISLPKSLLLAGTFLISSLAFDLCQYVLATILWKCFHRKKELSRFTPDREVKLPSSYSKILYVLFYFKIFLSISGYIFLLYYMCRLLI